MVFSSRAKNWNVLGLVGAGQLAREHVAYLSSVLPIERVVVWSRSPATVQQFRDDISTEGLPVDAVNPVTFFMTPGQGVADLPGSV